MAEAYETKTEMPLQEALEARLGAEELVEVNKRVPWRGFPPPRKAPAAAAARAAASRR